MLGGRKTRSNKGIKRGPYRNRKGTRQLNNYKTLPYKNGQLKIRKTRSNKGIKRGPYGPRILNRLAINNNQCKILDVIGREQILTGEYPGDEWVHDNLMEDRHIPLSFFKTYHPNIFRETYNNYNSVCEQ